MTSRLFVCRDASLSFGGFQGVVKKTLSRSILFIGKRNLSFSANCVCVFVFFFVLTEVSKAKWLHHLKPVICFHDNSSAMSRDECAYFSSFVLSEIHFELNAGRLLTFA